MDGGAINYTLRKPVGVVGCISPWNLPIYLLTWKIAPALAAGNTVVAKPSEITPMTAYILSEICQEINFPKGVNQFFECTGNVDVISKGFECLNQEGNEILIGVPRYKNKAQFYTLDLHLGKKLIGCKGGDFSPDNDFFDYSKIINNKKFILKDFITNEIALNDINDVFSDMRKQKILGKCIINLTQE